MAQGTMKRLGHTSAQGMLWGPSRRAAGGSPVQNPSGDAWVTAEGSPACSERTGISAVLPPPGDAQPVPRRGRKSRWNRLKKANPPVVSQNGPLVTMRGLQLSLQSVTPKHLPGAFWRAGAKPARRPWEATWEQGPAPALPTPCIQGSSPWHLQPAPCTDPAPRSPSPQGAATASARASSTHLRDLPSCSGDAQPGRIFHNSHIFISLRDSPPGTAAPAMFSLHLGQRVGGRGGG